MKSLIVYSSQTENTKKLADVIYDTLDGEKEIFQVDQDPSLEGYDQIFIGFWFQAGKPDPKTLGFLEQVKDSKVFLFATHGAAKGSDHVKNAVNTARELLKDVDVTGVFTCQGEVNPKVLEKVKQKPEPPVWINDAADAVGHPNQEDFTALKQALTQL
ncbi:MAG: flavodoxin family protein [Thermodesulfobacteriota bacterium]